MLLAGWSQFSGANFKDLQAPFLKTYYSDVLPRDVRSIWCFWHHSKTIKSTQLVLLITVMEKEIAL